MRALESTLTASNATHVVNGFSWMAATPDAQVDGLSSPVRRPCCTPALPLL